MTDLPNTANDNDRRARNSHLWARHPDDYYTEPQWVSEQVFRQEEFRGTIHDPACGSGRIVRAAQAAGLDAWGSDIVQRSGYCGLVSDYLTAPQWTVTTTSVVSNPPFKHAEAFIRRALGIATHKVVMILPASFMFGEERSEWLETTPLRRVLNIVPRPSMPPGPVVEAGLPAGGGTKDFVVAVWVINYDGPIELGFLRNPGSQRALRAAQLIANAEVA